MTRTIAYTEYLRPLVLPASVEREARLNIEKAAERIAGLKAAIAGYAAHDDLAVVRRLHEQLDSAESTLVHYEAQLVELVS